MDCRNLGTAQGAKAIFTGVSAILVRSSHTKENEAKRNGKPNAHLWAFTRRNHYQNS